MSEPELPLFLSGVPAVVEGWLRLAGVPVASFQPETGGGRELRWEPGRVMLFDSRDAGGRADAGLATSCGMTTLDLAELVEERSRIFRLGERLRRRTVHPGRHVAKSQFFDRFKKRVEACGGVWARLADVPFPYRTALCRGSDFHALESAGLGDCFEAVSADRAGTLIRCHYLYGRPLFVRAPLEPAEAAGPIAGSDAFPLLWQTTADEFSRWWRFRQGVAVRMRKSDSAYRIECDCDFGEFQPMLEIWRGAHVASIPLGGREIAVGDEGLVFRHEPHRHPAGFTLWAGDDGPRDEECRPAYLPQSA